MNGRGLVHNAIALVHTPQSTRLAVRAWTSILRLLPRCSFRKKTFSRCKLRERKLPVCLSVVKVMYHRVEHNFTCTSEPHVKEKSRLATHAVCNQLTSSSFFLNFMQRKGHVFSRGHADDVSFLSESFFGVMPFGVCSL